MSGQLEGRMESEDISKINHQGALLNVTDTLASYLFQIGGPYKPNTNSE